MRRKTNLILICSELVFGERRSVRRDNRECFLWGFIVGVVFAVAMATCSGCSMPEPNPIPAILHDARGSRLSDGMRCKDGKIQNHHPNGGWDDVQGDWELEVNTTKSERWML